MRSGPGVARTILLSHIISARPSKQPLMVQVRTFLKVYIELDFYFLVSARTNKRHHHHTRCLYLSPSQLRLIKRISNFKVLSLSLT